MENPSQRLPRDPSGSWLHLKLKRFSSIEDLTMPYAIKTWKATPHDAEADLATTNRSTCRQCHKGIARGDLRVRLFLQCHKGCKMSAYFHGNGCVWKYPETAKLESVDEIVGWDDLPEVLRAVISQGLQSVDLKRKLILDEEDSSPIVVPSRKKVKTMK